MKGIEQLFNKMFQWDFKNECIENIAISLNAGVLGERTVAVVVSNHQMVGENPVLWYIFIELKTRYSSSR